MKKIYKIFITALLLLNSGLFAQCTFVLTSPTSSLSQYVCKDSAIENITYAIGGTGMPIITGLPPGVVDNYFSGTVTIIGTPTISGNYTFYIMCGSIVDSGYISVRPELSRITGTGLNVQSVCVNNPLETIKYYTGFADGATVSGLPPGVSQFWVSDTLTIIGTPTSPGNYPFTVNLLHGCGSANGTITVAPINSINLTSVANSDSQTVCINAPISNISYSTTGAIGAMVTGLPSGVISSWSANVLTISGTPQASQGTFTYTISLTGGCGNITKSGTLQVKSNNSITLLSGAGSNIQSICFNTSISQIKYKTAGATNVTVSGLPSNVAYTFINDTITISGTPTATGNFNYSIALIGGCGNISATGSLQIIGTPLINPISDKTFCNGTFVSNGILFTSSSPGAGFSYTNSNPAIGLPASGSGSILPFNASNATSNPISATITVFIKASADSCVGASTSFTITVQPGPIMTSAKTASVCNNNAFNYTATSSTGTGTNFSWSRAAVSGISNPASSGASSLISETLNNTTTQPIVVKYIFTLSLGSGCVTTDSLLLTVNPTPVINSITDKTFCNGTFVSNGIVFTSSSPGAGFSYTNSNPAIGLPASGSGSILPFNASNATSNPIFATITVFIKASADSCVGASTSFTITVQPGPIMTSAKTASVCNNSPFNYTATSSTGSSTGTNLSWSRAAVSGISNSAGSGVSSLISETLVNTTVQPIVVKYLFTLSLGSGCVTTDSLLLTVNPTPVINPVNDTTFCNASLVNGIAFSSTTPVVSIAWNSNYLIGFGSSGSGNIPSFVATNTGDTPITAIISLSASVGNGLCFGANVLFSIIVNPSPTLTSAKIISVCNNTLFNYTATSSTTIGTNFSWTRIVVSGISNSASNGANANISETLVNTTTQPIVVKYIFTLSVGNNCDRKDTLSVTVHPTPKLKPLRDTTVCNSDLIPSYGFGSLSPNTSFTWRSSRSIGFGINGSDSIPSFFADNRTNTQIKDTVTVSIKTGNNICPGPDSVFIITVLPTPHLSSSKTTSVCNNAPFTYVATSFASNTNFTWKRDAVPGISNAAANASIPTINETLTNNTTQPVIAKYNFTLSTLPSSPTGLSGCKIYDTLLVTVYPTPTARPLNDTIFCNRQIVSGILFTSVSPDSSFTWTCFPSIGFGNGGTGSIKSFSASNSTSIPITALVKVVANVSNCPGKDTMSFRISVNPSPAKPNFTSRSLYADTDTLRLCKGTGNINFNIKQPTSGDTYRWVANPSGVSIRDVNDANTVMSFTDAGTYSIKVIATNNTFFCLDSATQTVLINATQGIDTRKIILKQPGNLLFYPDNSMDKREGYQWGYDSLLRTNPDTAFSAPLAIAGQVYQVFIPAGRFIKNNELDTLNYTYWVMLQKSNCVSRVYYNGPYALGRSAIVPQESNDVKLKVLPNPTNGIFDISLSGNIYGVMQATIYNAMGQAVSNTNFSKNTSSVYKRINSGHLPSGLYYLIINSSDLKKVVTRFIIQH